jgi:hypothetical protein
MELQSAQVIIAGRFLDRWRRDDAAFGQLRREFANEFRRQIAAKRLAEHSRHSIGNRIPGTATRRRALQQAVGNPELILVKNTQL